MVWFAKFCSGEFSLENEPRGRPQHKVNNDELKAIVESGTPQTTPELASKFGVSIPIILDYLRQINNVKKLCKRSASWLDKDEALKYNQKPNIYQKKLMVTVWWNSHG